MAAPRKTVADLLLAVRQNLDEREEAFWLDTELIARLDDAQHMVWSRVKALKSDYFDVQRSSTDGSVTILGEAYDTAGFAIAASTTSYTLPPDMDELKLIECITSGYEAVTFAFADMTSAAFRSLLATVDAQEPSGFLADIYVDAEYRRGGVGKALVAGLVDWFHEKGLSYYEWHVAARNEDSLAFWRSLGGREVMLRMRAEVDTQKE